MNKIILKDAFVGIEELEDESVDLFILDPNYQDWDSFIDRGLIELVLRKLKKDGNALAFTKQPFDFKLRNKIDPHWRRTLTWTFTNGGAWVSKRLPLVSFQNIFWFSKSKDFYVDVRTGVEYDKSTKPFSRSSKVFGDWEEKGRDFVPSEDGKWIRDHYHFNKPHTGKIPAKPEELARILVKCFCREGGLMLDPFAGSGVFCRVAQSIGRNFIGFEISEELTTK
jgi:DNA modification methylase